MTLEQLAAVAVGLIEALEAERKMLAAIDPLEQLLVSVGQAERLARLTAAGTELRVAMTELGEWVQEQLAAVTVDTATPEKE